MSRNSASRSVVAVFVAFMEVKTWRQSELAERLNLGRDATRRLLQELVEAGFPLVRDPEPPHVYWSVPKTWMPGGVSLPGEDVRVAMRLLARVPQSAARDTLMAKLLQLSPKSEPLVVNESKVVGEDFISVVQDACAHKITLSIDYFSGSRRQRTKRHVSVHHIEYGARVRFVGTCHRSDHLKTFRLDGIYAARLDPQEPFRPASPEALAHLNATAIDGFVPGGEPTTCVFRIESTVAGWVERVLPPGELSVEPQTDGSLYVTARTTALDVLARFIVGLGDAACAETPALASRVRALAAASLRRHQAAQALSATQEPPSLTRPTPVRRRRTRVSLSPSSPRTR